MAGDFHITRLLIQEHEALMTVMERLIGIVRNTRQSGYSAVVGDDIKAVLSLLPHFVRSEIGPHFAFEEDHLFPLIDARSGSEHVRVLLDDHRQVRPLGFRLLMLVELIENEGFNEKSWEEFHNVAIDFATRICNHARFENAVTIPLVNDALDEETDRKLVEFYETPT